MKTVIIQSYRTHDVPSWIARCLESVEGWAAARGYDRWLTDDGAFALCGDEYLAKVGDNKRSITNLCRLELIRRAHAEGYERAIWIDADVFVFDPARLDFPVSDRLVFAREAWVAYNKEGWYAISTFNNCVVVSRPGDPDLDLIIATIRHVARHHPIRSNFQLGVELLRGLDRFLYFELMTEVGMLSNFVVMAIARNVTDTLKLQATKHGMPIYAANLSASEHLVPVVPEAATHRAMDILEATQGGVINDWLDPATPNGR